MIYDNLANFRRYAGIAPEYWVRAFTFLEQLTPTTPEGRYELEGDRLYLLVQRYEVQPDSSHPAEVHRRYLDVQLLLDGVETIYQQPLPANWNEATFNQAGDIGFFPFERESATPLRLYPGVFAAFFPGEGHRPRCGSQLQTVRKVVVKLRLD